MSATEFDQPVAGLAVAREWPAVMFVGVMTLIIGVIVIAWPSETLTVLSILLGIQFVVFGISRLIGAFADDALAPGLTGFVGVLMIASGVIILRHPFETVAVLATILGAMWIVGGSIDVIGSIADRRADSRFLRFLMGALSLVAGVVVVAWPTPTLAVIAWIAGLYLITFGVVIIASAFQLRRLVDA